MKTLCIAGKNDIAVNVVEYAASHFDNIRIVCVINSNDTGINSWQRSLKWYCTHNDIPIVSLEELYNLKDLVFVSTEFDRIINPDRFKHASLYNVHFSLLPRYKGMYTSVWPILNGETETGVTLHIIRRGIDTGEIIDQIRIPILYEMNSLEVYKECIANGTELVTRSLQKLLKGTISAIPQISMESTYYSKKTIDYSKLRLNLNATAHQIHNQIRAFAFRPYQLISLGEVGIVGSIILDTVSDEKPGTIIEETATSYRVSTIDYDLIMYKDVLKSLMDEIKAGNNSKAISLCEYRAIIHEKEEHGWTPLTVSVISNNIEMVHNLIKMGADINVLDNLGRNLLVYAKEVYVGTGDSTLFEYLYSLGISIHLEDYAGKSLYDCCRSEGIDMIGEIHI